MRRVHRSTSTFSKRRSSFATKLLHAVAGVPDPSHLVPIPTTRTRFVHLELPTSDWMRALPLNDSWMLHPTADLDRKDHGPLGAYDGTMGGPVRPSRRVQRSGITTPRSDSSERWRRRTTTGRVARLTKVLCSPMI